MKNIIKTTILFFVIILSTESAPGDEEFKYNSTMSESFYFVTPLYNKQDKKHKDLAEKIDKEMQLQLYKNLLIQIKFLLF